MKTFKIGDEFNYSLRAMVERALGEYNQGKSKTERIRYVVYWNIEKNAKTIRLTDEEFAFAWRNTIRNEIRDKEGESRCLIPSKRYNSFKVCRADCAHCPYQNDVKVNPKVSLEAMEDSGTEPATQSSLEDDVLDAIEKETRLNAIKTEMKKLNQTDRTILLLSSQGLSYGEICETIGRDRYFVMRRKKALINLLKNNLKNF